MAIDDAADVYYFNDKGVIVKGKAELNYIHEVIHTLHGLNLTDNNLRNMNDAQLNQIADQRGDTVNWQNIVAAQMNWVDDVQASYVVAGSLTLFVARGIRQLRLRTAGSFDARRNG